jgi:hypothetical protein
VNESRPIVVLALLLVLISGASQAGEGQLKDYSLLEFGCRVQIPSDWIIYREANMGVAVRVSFGLPKVWSDLEAAEIENAVSISAYRRRDLAAIDEVVHCERDRIRDILTSSEDVDLEFGKAELYVTEIQGNKYKSIAAFALKNGIAYVFGFTATFGTYDKNIDKFTEFLSRLEFPSPEGVTDLKFETRYDEARSLYRAGSFNARRVIQLLEEDLVDNTENVEALKLLAITYVGTRQFTNALGAIEHAMALEEGIVPRTQLLKAKILHLLDRNIEARDFLKARSAFFDSDIAFKAERDRLLLEVETALSQDQQPAK